MTGLPRKRHFVTCGRTTQEKGRKDKRAPPPPLRSCSPLQEGSPTKSALETVVTSDRRITDLQREVELLEAEDADNADATPSRHQTPPASQGGGGVKREEESFAVTEVRREIAKLSLEEKGTRLAEAYEDLDVLVRYTTPVESEHADSVCVLESTCLLCTSDPFLPFGTLLGEKFEWSARGRYLCQKSARCQLKAALTPLSNALSRKKKDKIILTS